MRLGDFPNCEDVLKRLVYRILFSEEALVFAKVNILAGEEMALAEKEKSSRMAEALAKL